MKCFDVVSPAVNEATIRFSDGWIINEKYVSILKEYCSIIDSLYEEFNTTSVVAVVNADKTLSIILECSDMVFNSTDHIVYDLIQRAIRLEFSATGNDSLNIEFVFPSLWSERNKGELY